MKFFASVFAIAMAVASVNAAVVEPLAKAAARGDCVHFKMPCQPDGSMFGNCCSGLCNKLPDWRYGECA